MNDSGMSLEDLQRKLAALEFGPLDEKTDQALEQLAAQYPDLIKYDSARGMLRFASDLTFDSGSAIVKDSARSSIDCAGQDPDHQLGVGLRGPHRRPHRLAAHQLVHLCAGIPDQRSPFLPLRDLGVRDELTKLGVAPTKIMAAGWGEFRPMVANASNGNTPRTAASRSSSPARPVIRASP